MNQDSQNPRVPAMQPGKGIATSVRVHYFLFPTDCHVNSRLQMMATLEDGNYWQMWEFIRLE